MLFIQVQVHLGPHTHTRTHKHIHMLATCASKKVPHLMKIFLLLLSCTLLLHATIHTHNVNRRCQDELAHTHTYTHLLHFSSVLFSLSLSLSLSLLLSFLTALNFISLATCKRESAIHLPAEHHNVLPQNHPHPQNARPPRATLPGCCLLSTTKWTQKFERSKTFAACF